MCSSNNLRQKFLADAHLGQLAKYLRLLGFDTIFDIRLSDNQIIDVSQRENRIVLTRDRGVLNKLDFDQGYFVKASPLREQITDLINRFSLAQQLDPFTRCLSCNGALITIDRDHIPEELHKQLPARYNLYNQCSTCKKIYWQGSHYARMNKFIESLKQNQKGIAQ